MYLQAGVVYIVSITHLQDISSTQEAQNHLHPHILQQQFLAI